MNCNAEGTRAAMTDSLTVSLVQMDCQLGAPEANFRAATEYMRQAAAHRADLALFPELWPSAYALETAARFAAPVAVSDADPGWFGRFASLARQFGLAAAGSLLEMDGERIYNTMVLYDAQGRLQARYRKLHLVPMLDEPRFLAAGSAMQTAPLHGHKAGLAVCYDLRFPELFRHYALAGCPLMLLAAEWPHPRSRHWRTLLRSRAIENQCFVVACNRVGASAGVSFCGHSAVIDPWGETVLDAGAAEGVFTATLDLDQVAKVRRRIPVLADRRPDVYG